MDGINQTSDPNDGTVSMRVCFDSFCFSSAGPNPDPTSSVPTTVQQPHHHQLVHDYGQPAPGLLNMAEPHSRLNHHHHVLNNNNNNNSTTSNNQNNNNNAAVDGPESLPAQNENSAQDVGLELGKLRDVLRLKDDRILELEAQLRHQEAEIVELRSHLDKFLSVLPFKSPLSPGKPKPRKHRAQGISAEPLRHHDLVSLQIIEKSERWELILILMLVATTEILFFCIFFARNFR